MKPLRSSNIWHLTQYDISLIAVLLLGLVTIMFYSLAVAINVPVFHVDGAFQTASGLFRLSSGQLPSRDFIPYLGIGPLFVIYPFFKLCGNDLSASVFASHFVVLLTQIYCVAVIHFFIWRSKSVLTSAAVGMLFCLVVMSLNESAPHWLLERFTPGHSLRPLRSAAPYIALALAYFSCRKVKQVSYLYLILGAISGAALIWSNDFGILTMMSMIFLSMIIAITRRQLTVRTVISIFGGALILAFVLFEISTAGHPFEIIRYNLVDVTHDQWWYFGPWSVESRFFSIASFANLLDEQVILPFAVLCVVAIFFLIKKELLLGGLLWLGLVLFLGGLVASVGGHLDGYFAAFYFWGGLTAGFGSLRGLVWLFSKWLQHMPTDFLENIRQCILVIVIVIVGIQAFASFTIWRQSGIEAASDHSRFYVKELSGYLPTSWSEYVDLARKTEPNTEVEEYWGLWSAIRKPQSQWPVDSVIHALGAVRDTVKKNMGNNPAIVITTRADFSMWQAWNVSQNYWFYRHLFEKYIPFATSPATVLWQLKSIEVGKWPTVQCEARQAAGTLEIIAPSKGYYEVTVNFADVVRERHLLLVKNNINFVPTADGYLSIDPSEKQTVFPAYLHNAGLNQLDFKMLPAKAAGLAVLGCTVRKIIFEDENILQTQLPSHMSPQPILGNWIHSPEDLWATYFVPNIQLNEYFYVTDRNWNRGRARHGAGFFVPNIASNTVKFIPGRSVLFQNGEQRLITRVEPNAQYLNIMLEGDSLDMDKVGYPNTFEVRDCIEESPVDLSDANWLHGVATSGAKFVIRNLPANKSLLILGRKIRFANGEVRIVTSQNESGRYLIITLDGPSLDGSKIGFPNKYEVLK